MSEFILSIRDVSKRFGGAQALSSVSLDIRSGEVHAICGENGAGKSTLMKIVAGVLTDYEGDIVYRGRVVRWSGTRDAEANGVQMIHQELNLVEELSATANIFLGRELTSRGIFLKQRDMERRTAQLLEELECRVSVVQPCGTMRVGDQQLIEIAKALLHDCDILIMDEPTSALTDSEVERLDRVLVRLKQKGVTILYISHKMKEIFRWADRITVLCDGQWIETVPAPDTSPAQVTQAMVGREILQDEKLAAGRQKGARVLRVENLYLPWPGHVRQWRLEDISLDVHAGEIVGVAGLMGAGRTELLETIYGASPVVPEGSIELHGKQVCFRHPREAVEAGVAMTTEDRKRLGVFPEMSVAENMTISDLARCRGANAEHAGGATAAKSNDVPQQARDDKSTGQLLNKRKQLQRAANGAQLVRMRRSNLHGGITNLSGGNQQKALICRGLLTSPQLLLLDDPTRGIDVSAKAELYELFDRLCRQGMAILMTSSELPELLAICDRIVVLCEGRITGRFDHEEATEETIMAAAVGQLSLQHEGDHDDGTTG